MVARRCSDQIMERGGDLETFLGVLLRFGWASFDGDEADTDLGLVRPC